jgi:hypothetical protein
MCKGGSWPGRRRERREGEKEKRRKGEKEKRRKGEKEKRKRKRKRRLPHLPQGDALYAHRPEASPSQPATVLWLAHWCTGV